MILDIAARILSIRSWEKIDIKCLLHDLSEHFYVCMEDSDEVTDIYDLISLLGKAVDTDIETATTRFLDQLPVETAL